MELRKILLVDDEDDIRTIGEISLAHVGGWDVVMASSGEEALVLAAEIKPDLILLDVMMPKMDGPTTLEHLKANAETRAIPVIFLTAKVQKHEVERYLKLGASGVIAKPFDPMSLPDQLRSITASM